MASTVDCDGLGEVSGSVYVAAPLMRCDRMNGAPEVWMVFMYEPPATRFYGKG